MLIQPEPSEPQENSSQDFGEIAGEPEGARQASPPPNRSTPAPTNSEVHSVVGSETEDAGAVEEVTRLTAPEEATADEQPQEAFQESTVEGELPPEAQGEVNGGPLGCCLGLVVGLFFSIFVGVVGIGPNLGYLLGYVLPFGALTDVRIATGCIAFTGTIIFAYFGWKIGRRLYREYEPPVPKDRRRRSKRRPEPKEVQEHSI